MHGAGGPATRRAAHETVTARQVRSRRSSWSLFVDVLRSRSAVARWVTFDEVACGEKADAPSCRESSGRGRTLVAEKRGAKER